MQRKDQLITQVLLHCCSITVEEAQWVFAVLHSLISLYDVNKYKIPLIWNISLYSKLQVILRENGYNLSSCPDYLGALI